MSSTALISGTYYVGQQDISGCAIKLNGYRYFRSRRFRLTNSNFTTEIYAVEAA
jgi:hypothetical protein